MSDMLKALPKLVELAANPHHSVDFMTVSEEKIYCKLKSGESLEFSKSDIDC